MARSKKLRTLMDEYEAVRENYVTLSVQLAERSYMTRQAEVAHHASRIRAQGKGFYPAPNADNDDALRVYEGARLALKHVGKEILTELGAAGSDAINGLVNLNGLGTAEEFVAFVRKVEAGV